MQNCKHPNYQSLCQEDPEKVKVQIIIPEKMYIRQHFLMWALNLFKYQLHQLAFKIQNKY